VSLPEKKPAVVSCVADKFRVYQSNKLVESSYTMTLNEKRLVMYAASRLDSSKAPPKDGLINVSADAFADAFGMERRHAYGVLAEAVERLYAREIRRYEKGQEVESMRWIYHKHYIEGAGQVELGFSPTVLPHLTQLTREFTGFQLKHISSLNSFYAFRLYELMAQRKTYGTRDFELERLRELFQLDDKYPKVYDFRKYVLDPSIKEINQHTDLSVSLEPLRTGRNITGFKFLIQQTDQIPLGL
jgi:plasmid replication initiation protein